MKFMNEARIYGQSFREEAGGDGDAGGAPNPADGGEGGESGSDDLAKQLEALKAERDALLNKNNELLGESKKAKAARREAERLAQEEAKRKAEAEGNYQQLYESSEKQRADLQAQLEELTGNVHKKEVNNTAMKLAVALNPLNDAAAEDLAFHISKRLKYTDDGIKVTDEAGNLTVSTPDDLKNEISGSARFSHFLKGNQSSGGGAAGGSSSGGAAKVMNRADFDALDPVAKSKFMKDGGKLTD